MSHFRSPFMCRFKQKIGERGPKLTQNCSFIQANLAVYLALITSYCKKDPRKNFSDIFLYFEKKILHVLWNFEIMR
jgi:hypothetical protein